MKISFHGADQSVTGSCHLISCSGKKILIDCGLYQGSHELTEENAEPFGFKPEEIDYLLLTHAHLDHCGRIPLLVDRGFKGEIITTSASRELAKLVMLDSAHIQESEAEWKTRKEIRKGSDKIIEPLYTTLDVLNSLDYFGRVAQYDKPIKLSDDIQVTFIDAGHILGSASIVMNLTENNRHKKVLFSGDLGYSNRAILRNPTPPPKVDVVVMETTYGDRKHKALKPSIEELFNVINDTFKRGGNVIIPTFALERAQELLFYMREGVEKDEIPSFMQVFLDSPMAISATEIFRRHSECYDRKTAAIFNQHNDPFMVPGLHFTRETADSIALNRIESGAVIMAGSGMCTGGRIRHHLKQHIGRKSSSIVFVGYAAIGTLARRILDGAQTVKLFGEEVAVHASIHTIGGFSAHADCEELYQWYQHTGTPQKTFLVHGEEKSMKVFASRIQHSNPVMPGLNEEFEL